MKILFLTHYYFPHVGGVEKHVFEIKKCLEKKGNSVKVISGADIEYPNIKFLGLVYIWFWFFKNRKIIEDADIVHIHDVFIWYLPFRFLYPSKKVFTTIHGLEWNNPLSKMSILQKILAAKLSAKTIGVGRFLEKYLGIKFDLITYGAVTLIHTNVVKRKNSIVYVGRLEENTGLLKFFNWLKTNPKYQVDFCGDGELRKECEKFGNVHGFTNPTLFLKKAEYCVPGGYLAALEGLSYKCKLKLFWSDKVKEDYWKLSPFIREDVNVWAKAQTWNKLANEYLNLYHSIK
jgi:glycosyltransferase involved in cell wall biosynthesis